MTAKTEVPADHEARDWKRPQSCSVVIPTFKRNEELARCLASVQAQDYSQFDMIVVDNSPGDDRTRELAESAGARYVAEPRPGLCRARNRGALVSSADIIAYLDDDSVPEAGWLTALVRSFENPKVMAVGGRTVPLKLDADSEILFASIRGDAYNRPEHIVVDKSNPHWFEICGFGGIGPGCNMAVRRSAFELWPGFHERTDRGTPVYGGGEQHAFFSLVSLGHAVAYNPDAIVRHPFPPTMERLQERYLRDLTASTAYFTMMLFEASGHRRLTLKYLWESLKGTPRRWRGVPMFRPRVVSRSRSVIAAGLGPLKYLQGLLEPTDN